jgi:DNA-binding NarL/FixJ family response regulator
MRIDADHPLCILIADDHSIFRDGFKLLLKKLKSQHYFLAGEAGNGKELVDAVTRIQPHVVITDIQMPVMDGIEATRLIKAKHPHIEVIALTMFNEEHLVVDMLEAGASGYLLKNTSRDELQKALEIVTHGGVYFTPESSAHLANTIRQKSAPVKRNQNVKFSEREKEIIELVCKGLTNKEIAHTLNLSTRTIESHRENIYIKTDARSAVEMVIYAIKHGVISLDKL